MKNSKLVMDSASNSIVYSRSRKFYLAKNTSDVKCALCPYHRGENVTRWPKHKSWKLLRKNQWKNSKPQNIPTDGDMLLYF